MSTPDWVLSSTEEQELTAKEAVIQRGIKAFWETGQALSIIKEKRLYRGEFESFLDYCRDRWGLEPRRAQQLMESGQVIEDLNNANHGSYLPESERQARELSRVPREQRAEVWEKAVQAAPEGKVTAKEVRRVAEPYVPSHIDKVSRGVKGWPSDQHHIEALHILLNTRDPRGTIARFLGVHDSLVSNVQYQETHSRTALEEKREQAYLEAGRRLGMTDEQVEKFLSDSAGTVRQ